MDGTYPYGYDYDYDHDYDYVHANKRQGRDLSGTPLAHVSLTLPSLGLGSLVRVLQMQKTESKGS